MRDDYHDIIHLPYPSPGTRARMTRLERAAQFAPFATLTGYHERIRALEEEKMTRPTPDEEQAADLNRQLQLLKTTRRNSVLPGRRKRHGVRQDRFRHGYPPVFYRTHTGT